MKERDLTELTNEELLQKVKSQKNKILIDAGLVGFSVGVVIYSVVKNGFGLFICFPLLLAYIIVRDSANSKMLEKELQKEVLRRNLN